MVTLQLCWCSRALRARTQRWSKELLEGGSGVVNLARLGFSRPRVVAQALRLSSICRAYALSCP